jgi:hypothetical protein
MNDLKTLSEQPPNPDPSEVAKAFSSLGASKGGMARAKNLTPERRSEIARKAVEARWAKQGKAPLPRATHTGVLEIGDNVKIECSVLEDGTRVFSQRGVAKAFGAGVPSGSRREDDLPAFLSSKNLKPFITNDLIAKTAHIEYISGRGSVLAHGVRAEAIPKICRVWLEARDAGALLKQQLHIAAAADIIMRGLAEVGIIALVDEATGYQADRARDALAKILEAFIAKELRPWVRTFEPEFYQELFRLKGIEFKGTLKAPRFIGKLTNDLIYDRLAPGVREELNRINPTNEKGQRKHKNFQWLTQHVGYQKLKQHLASVTVLMKVFDDWDVFKKNLDRALPKQDSAPLFDPPPETT